MSSVPFSFLFTDLCLNSCAILPPPQRRLRGFLSSVRGARVNPSAGELLGPAYSPLLTWATIYHPFRFCLPLEKLSQCREAPRPSIPSSFSSPLSGSQFSRSPLVLFPQDEGTDLIPADDGFAFFFLRALSPSQLVLSPTNYQLSPSFVQIE